MALAGGNILPLDLSTNYVLVGVAGVALFAVGIFKLHGEAEQKRDEIDEVPGLFRSMLLFCYSCFIKPHAAGSDGTQQAHLESFYASQSGVYDTTRKPLLKGREDMLALVAAQLRFKAQKDGKPEENDGDEKRKRIWVDVGGGTGWNIEAMSAFVDVPTFFSRVYLVDFSPSLCDVARKRFDALGWSNVVVVCQDARSFDLQDHEDSQNGLEREKSWPRSPTADYFSQKRAESGGADLITMSYSLSMIPDYFSVIDSLSSLLSPNGIMGVVDFYAQSKVDVAFRNYTGGIADRHVGYLGRTFWRAWFDLDRVSLEPSRRDYLEYRFGTILTINSRNYGLGYIPYHIWVGCPKKPFSSTSLPNEIIERIDALATESPVLVPANSSNSITNALTRAVERTAPEIRSKAFDAAFQNISAQLPLPASFYQNHHWRIYYDDTLQKHTQFQDEYIYAFTWEDARVDERLLNLGPDDVVLAITSAGDNILSYARQQPATIHAIDLNPAQNHLLELKVAAYAAAIPYEDFWKIFGEGKHPHFRSLLVSRLSPHLSGRAFQYWLARAHIFTDSRGRGLYDTGGSKYAIRIFRWISHIFGCRSAVRGILSAKTLNEQREVWSQHLRPALFSQLVSRFVLSSEAFLWAALGVPKNQLAMIEADHSRSDVVRGACPTAKDTRSHAVWHYMVNTLDPVVDNTHIAADNPYYYVCLEGRFSPKCHPDYLSRETHRRLSRPGALDGLRIHTDEIAEVIARLRPGSLTVAVVMDSMDWFDPASAAAEPEAVRQISRLNRALRPGGRVMLRSSALSPWYIVLFEARGFAAKRVGERVPGRCIDRVNMYASCWICTKVDNLRPDSPPSSPPAGGSEVGDGIDVAPL